MSGNQKMGKHYISFIERNNYMGFFLCDLCGKIRIK